MSVLHQVTSRTDEQLLREHLLACRELVRRGLLRPRLLSKDAAGELLVASLLGGVLADSAQNPGYDLRLDDGHEVQVKVRCRGVRDQPGKVEFRPGADFDSLVVLDLDREGTAVRRAGRLSAADAHDAITGGLDRQGRAKVQLQHFFRHPGLHDLTASAQQYALPDVYLGVALGPVLTDLGWAARDDAQPAA